jgi:Spy/CpxP family protein refolding chaperone
MKKLVMLVLVAMMAAGTCFAQPGGTPEERLKREIDGLTTALSLTPDQVAKVTPIVTEAQKARSEMFQKMRDSGGTPDREKMMAEGQKMQADTDAKLKAVITAEQGTKLDAFRKKQAEERAARMQNR